MFQFYQNIGLNTDYIRLIEKVNNYIINSYGKNCSMASLQIFETMSSTAVELLLFSHTLYMYSLQETKNTYQAQCKYGLIWGQISYQTRKYLYKFKSNQRNLKKAYFTFLVCLSDFKYLTKVLAEIFQSQISSETIKYL